jgi:hypothetical protein
MRRTRAVTLALLVLGCWEHKDQALFGDELVTTGGTGQAGGSAGNSANAISGTDSGSGSSPGGNAPGGGGSAGASASGFSSGAASGGGTGGAGGGSGSGGSAIERPKIESCSMLEGATVSELNGHCYRTNFQNLDFAAAVSACDAAGGHLVTIGSPEENDFVRDFHDGSHWLGATDGRPVNMAGAGAYNWVNDEPWTFSDWEDDQPNAYETDCPNEDDEADCFEHCAFQTDEGDWNDRSCWHTIVSICEWDVEPLTGAGGAAGGEGSGN